MARTRFAPDRGLISRMVVTMLLLGLVYVVFVVALVVELGDAWPLALLAAGGFGGRSAGLVYLYKRGSFHPFAPRGAQRRDTALELQIKAQLADELRVEPNLSRRFPVWGAPEL